MSKVERSSMWKGFRLPHAAVFCLAFQFAAMGQDNAADELVHLDIKGLPASPVRCLVKDRDGALWIGTENGLCRFDGVNVDVFRNIAGDSLSLPANYVQDLLIAPDGRIWVSSFGGIAVFDPHLMRFERKPLVWKEGRNRSYEAPDLFMDRDGGIWAANMSAGLSRFDANTDSFHEITALRAALPAKATPWIGGVLRDADGALWVADRLQLLRYEPASGAVDRYPFTPPGHKQEDREHLVRPVADPEREDMIQVTSWGLGVVRFNKRTGTFDNRELPSDLPPDLANISWSFLPMGYDRALVGMDRELRWFDMREMRFLPPLVAHDDQRAFGSIGYALLKDPDQRVWVGAIDGVHTLPPRSGALMTAPARAQNLCAAADGNGYWGVRQYAHRKLFRFDERLLAIDSIDLPGADRVANEPYCVYQARDGLVWIGTRDGPMSYHPSTRAFSMDLMRNGSDHRTGLASVTSIVEHANNDIWFACPGTGVFRYRPSSGLVDAPRTERAPGGPLHRHDAAMLCELDKDHIGIAYGSEGVGLIDTRTMSISDLVTTDTAHARLLNVQALVPHAGGVLHVVTRSDGIVVLRQQGDRLVRAAAYVDKDDLENKYNDATGDANGITWIATDKGLGRFDDTEGSFQHFGPLDGFPLHGVATILSDKHGRIIAQNERCVRFAPSTFKGNGDLRGLYVRSFTVNGNTMRTHSANAPARLRHEQNTLTIEYAPIALLHADELHYEVRLNGRDAGWIDNGRSRSVSYVDLPPGEYRFEVRVIGSTDMKARAQLFFIIVPAFWQTWWFKLSIALLVCAFIFLLSRYILSLRYRQRIAALEREREVNAVRTRIARDIHDDIGSGLTRITMLSREMKSSTETESEKERLAGSIAKASSELIGQLGEIVWSVNPENDNAERFVAYVRDQLGRQFEELSVALRTDLGIEPGMEQRDIPPDVKRQVLMILKEMVSNALKHAQARTVAVTMRINAREVALNVADDGRGFDTTATRTHGNGLVNLLKRSEAISGTLKVESDANGTRYALRVPLPPPTFMRAT